MRLGTTLTRGLVASVALAGSVIATSTPADALPTASFTVSTTQPVVGEPVTFTFTGSCDVPPCRVTWRWFTSDGSHLGTTMGEGEQIQYAFAEHGIYSVAAKITNATSTHGSATATNGLAVSEIIADGDARVGYDGWRRVDDPIAAGGGYRLASTGHAPVGLSFTGRAVTFVAKAGPDRGIARIRVDGSTFELADLYAPTVRRRGVLVGNLAPGQHQISVASSTTRNAASAGSAVSVDEFVVAGTHIDDSDPRLTWGTWRIRAGAGANTVHKSAGTQATTQLGFRGTRVTWVTAVGPAQGRASVVIDGTTVATVDNYAKTYATGRQRTFAGFAAGNHLIEVIVLGQHNVDSLGNAIVSDGFTVA